ncbi:MAG: hypothetical protein WAL29_05090, partial [Bacteroidales bacterium]
FVLIKRGGQCVPIGPAIKGVCVTRSCPDRALRASGAASGHDPGTLATKLSRCKPARLNDVSRSGGEGMAWFLPSWYNF